MLIRVQMSMDETDKKELERQAKEVGLSVSAYVRLFIRRMQGKKGKDLSGWLQPDLF